MDTKTTLLVTGLIVVVAATTIAMSVGPVYAPGTCSSCARSFAPGQIAINNEIQASSVAPGQEFQGGQCTGCNGASSFAPGIEKTIPTGPGP